MIETIEAVENLPALLDIDGVDAYLVAPWDMALSMGEDITGSVPFSRKVVDTIDRAITTIVGAGRTCGMRVDLESVESFIGKGVTLLYDHADSMLARGSKTFLEKVESCKAGSELRERRSA